MGEDFGNWKLGQDSKTGAYILCFFYYHIGWKNWDAAALNIYNPTLRIYIKKYIFNYIKYKLIIYFMPMLYLYNNESPQ
jgi:hypothetical protein